MGGNSHHITLSPVDAPTVIGASTTGSSHRARDIGSQDAYAFRVRGGAVVVAVCDGLGSVSLSAVGAERASYLAVTAGELQLLETEPIKTALTMAEAARAAVEVQAEEREVDIEELATTFIGCVYRDGVLAVAHIGDGGVVASSGGSTLLVSGPEDGEYANEVSPITSDRWREHLRLSESEDVSEAAIFTDGVQRAALVRDSGAWTPLTGFFEPLFDFARTRGDAGSVEAFLLGEKMSLTSDDDKTLVLLSSVGWKPSIEAAAG